jgi:alanine dehydrogenase
VATARELTVTEVLVWSREARHAEAFTKKFPELNARSATLEKTCDCDVLVTITPSREPIIKDEWIREGMHINAIGADAPGKEELDPHILSRARVFVDDPAQAFHSGEINVPITKGLYQTWMIAGTLGEVVLGKRRDHCLRLDRSRHPGPCDCRDCDAERQRDRATVYRKGQDQRMRPA